MAAVLENPPMGFRLFGVNVEVHFSFLITSLFLGPLMGGHFDLQGGLTWTVVIFVSILVHEFGHAFAVKMQGLEPEIRLHGMGGTTSYRVLLPLKARAEIAISLAGPFAGFLFGGLILALDYFVLHTQIFVTQGGQFRHFFARNDFLSFSIFQLLWVNFGWGAVNLIPTLPFDGGHVLQALLGPRRMRLTLSISLGVALLATLIFYTRDMWWAAFLFAMSAFQAARKLLAAGDVGELQAPVAAPPREPPLPGEVLARLHAARRALEDEDFRQATTLAQDAVKLAGEQNAPVAKVKVEAYEILGWVAHARGDMDEAARWVKAAKHHGSPDVALIAAIMIGQGQPKEARKVLEEARATGDDRKEIVGPLIQILIAAGEVSRASAVALDIVDSLSDEDARKMAEIAYSNSAFEWAARLNEAVFARTHSANDAYEAARAYSSEGSHERALDLLRNAVKAGFSDPHRAWSEAAFEPLRAGQKLETVVPRP